MTKTKSTKRALLMSGLALMMCVAMLIGTTFAWFTDSVTSSGNIIRSGKLDVEMNWKDATANGEQQAYIDASTGAIFNYSLWEPGYVEAKNLEIINNGNLALKYQLKIVANGEVSDLANVIDVYYAEGEHTLTSRNMTELTRIGTLSEVISNMQSYIKGDLLENATDYFTIAFKMQESAGNEYRDMAIGTDFSVQLLATQFTYESDSFNNEYDKDATYPAISTANKTDARAITLTEGLFAITVPAEANNGKYAMEVANDAMKTNADGKTTLSFDLSLTKDGVDVADGSATYIVNINVGAGKIIESLTHNGQAVTDFDYNQSTGILTFTTDSFSPFAVVYYDDLAYGKVAKLGDTYYETFKDAYNAANDGDTLTLVSDVKDFEVELKKAITLDLGGKTITDAYIKTHANITLQNGAIKNINESYPIVINSGTLTMEKVAVEASKSDRAVWLRNSGTVLNFNSGSILATKGENNSYSTIYGVWVSQGATANINDGTIEVDAGANATAVAIFGNYVNTVNVTGGKISTSGTNYSYGIYTYGDIKVSNCEIVTNEKRYCYPSNGITYNKNYAIYTKGNVTISNAKITAYGPYGYLVNASGSNQQISIADVEFACVLSEIDKTKGNHTVHELIYGSSSSNTEITSGNFKGISANLTKGTATVSGGTFDVKINSGLLAEGYSLIDNGDGTWTVAK